MLYITNTSIVQGSAQQGLTITATYTIEGSHLSKEQYARLHALFLARVPIKISRYHKRRKSRVLVPVLPIS